MTVWLHAVTHTHTVSRKNVFDVRPHGHAPPLPLAFERRGQEWGTLRPRAACEDKVRSCASPALGRSVMLVSEQTQLTYRASNTSVGQTPLLPQRTVSGSGNMELWQMLVPACPC